MVDRSTPDAEITPLRVRPGRPVASGFTLLTPTEQAEHDAHHHEMQKRLLPWIEEADRCRGRAAAAARNAWIR